MERVSASSGGGFIERAWIENSLLENIGKVVAISLVTPVWVANRGYNWVKKEVLPLIGDGIKWIYDHVLSPLVTRVYRFVMDNILHPLWKHFVKACNWVIDEIVIPTLKKIDHAVKWVFDTLIIPAWKHIAKAINWVIDEIISPILKKISQ